MKLKHLPIAALALLLPLSACSTPADTGNQSSPSASASASTGTDGEVSAPVVDRAPSAELPAITFDDAGIPTMEAIGSEPPTDISIVTLEQGDGEEVGEGEFITVSYAGFLWSDGTQFDSSYDSGSPISFGLEQVVDGWRYGLVGTRVGDRVQLVVPPEYGYGDQDSGSIPANSTLVFVVDIVGVTKADPAILKDATPTGEALPAGVSVEGELGAEPRIVFAEDAVAPTEPQVVVLSEGTGPEVTATDTLLYHAAGAEWGGDSSSTWEGSYQQVGSGGGEETVGKTVGSRVLLVYPGDEESETPTQVLVIDLLAVVPAQ